MKNQLTALDGLCDSLDVANVAGQDFDFFQGFPRNELKQSSVVTRVVTDQRAYPCPFLEERLHEMTADEPTAPGYEDLRTREGAHRAWSLHSPESGSRCAS